MVNKINLLPGPVQVWLLMESMFTAVMLPALWYTGDLAYFWLSLLHYNTGLAALLMVGLVADRIQRAG